MSENKTIELLRTNIMIDKKSSLSLRHATQKFFFTILWMGGIITILILLAVVGYVIIQGLKSINLEFLITPPRGGLSGEGGISTTIVTTLYLVILTISIATPLGVGAAIFLVEYAGDNSISSKFLSGLISLAHFGVETLAGIPSIIFGLFGYALFVATLKFGFSLLSASLAGACLVLPVIIRTTEEALVNCPGQLSPGKPCTGSDKMADNPASYPARFPAWHHHGYNPERRTCGQRNRSILCYPGRQLSHANIDHVQRPYNGAAFILPGNGYTSL